MKVGDLVMFCDGFSEVEAVLLVRLVPDTLPGGSIHGAVVMNEIGQHWVNLDNLIPIEEWETINESR